MARARRILHATDFSPASRRALAAAIALARHDRARLLVLHVLVPPSPFVGSDLPPSYVELEARARDDARRRLSACAARAARDGVRAEGRLVVGMPAEEIVRVARRERPDMIVVGTHGRTGIGRALMGSVADRVLLLAPCPVLTVRGRPVARRMP